jgi:hypothetical protein
MKGSRVLDGARGRKSLGHVGTTRGPLCGQAPSLRKARNWKASNFCFRYSEVTLSWTAGDEAPPFAAARVLFLTPAKKSAVHFLPRITVH